MLDWMRANVGETDRYVEGPNMRWVMENGVHLYPPAALRESKDAFLEFVRDHDVRYVIAEMESMHKYRYRGRIDRRLKFDGILEFDEQQGILELNVPADWIRVASDDDGIVEFIIYEIS